MDKKTVIGGTVAAALAAGGLYAIGKEAADNSAKQAQTPAAVTAPVGTTEPDPVIEETAPANEAVEQSEQSWGEWFASWLPDIPAPKGPSFEEETPMDIQRKNLENNY